jgi:riboflavin synthase
VFTGIIQEVGRVREVRRMGKAARLVIDSTFRRLAIGESVAINGACMTIVARSRGRFAVDVSPESLRRTTLGGLGPGGAVNLERSLTLADRLGGHIVQGHVDGVGRVVDITPEANAWIYTFEAPAPLARTLVEKGSIAVDGVSLTVAGVRGRRFCVAVIPHTARHTTLGEYNPGDRVNIEADVLAKYVEKLLGGARRAARRRGGRNKARRS